MARVSKRPSLVISDEIRVPVPGLVPPTHNHARYSITPLGHVFRDDGRLLTPTPGHKINFNGGSVSRSLALLVFLAFGRKSLVKKWNADQRNIVIRDVPHDVWVNPCGPTDEQTGRLRCSVHDVKLVPHSQLIQFGQRGKIPETQLPII